MLFARTPHLSKSFCSISPALVEVFIGKVPDKLYYSAWATLTTSTFLLTKIISILRCSFLRKARAFQGFYLPRFLSKPGCTRRLMHTACILKRTHLRPILSLPQGMLAGEQPICVGEIIAAGAWCQQIQTGDGRTVCVRG